MVFIVLFGLLTVLISLVMIARPGWWREKTIQFCHLPYMHPLEIILRLGFGAAFVFYAEQSDFPITFKVIGYLLLAVGVGLMLTPPSYHRRFGIWAIEKAAGYFRPAGFVSLPFGAFLIYAAF